MELTRPQHSLMQGRYLHIITEKRTARKSITKKPWRLKESADAHNNYAILLIDLERKNEAEEHYKKALEIKPDYADAHYNYANLLVDLERKERGGRALYKAWILNRIMPNVHYNYAILLVNLGRKTEAEEHSKRPWRSNRIMPTPTITTHSFS